MCMYNLSIFISTLLLDLKIIRYTYVKMLTLITRNILAVDNYTVFILLI